MHWQHIGNASAFALNFKANEIKCVLVCSLVSIVRAGLWTYNSRSIQGVFKHQKLSIQGVFKASLLCLALCFEMFSLVNSDLIFPDFEICAQSRNYFDTILYYFPSEQNSRSFHYFQALSPEILLFKGFSSALEIKN